MIYFIRVDDDNIKWYFIAPDEYPLEENDILISEETFYEETGKYSLNAKLSEPWKNKTIH